MSDRIDVVVLNDLKDALGRELKYARGVVGLYDFLLAALPEIAKLPTLDKQIAEATERAEVAETESAERVGAAAARTAEAELREREVSQRFEAERDEQVRALDALRAEVRRERAALEAVQEEHRAFLSRVGVKA